VVRRDRERERERERVVSESLQREREREREELAKARIQGKLHEGAESSHSGHQVTIYWWREGSRLNENPDSHKSLGKL